MDPHLRNCFQFSGVHDENFSTETSEDQTCTEIAVEHAMKRWIEINGDEKHLKVWKEEHVYWLVSVLKNAGYMGSLYASQSWMCFWNIHALDLMNVVSSFPDDFSTDLIDFIVSMQAPSGGFGGGPGQLPHVLATYAAVGALLTLGVRCNKLEYVMERIDTVSLLSFYKSLKISTGPNVGGMRVSDDGEVDIRAVYCCLAIVTLLGIADEELTTGMAEWIGLCQTHEGGMGAEPYNEAHGGYSFCGLASAVLLGRPEVIDLDSLLRWMTARQFNKEGGFSGRANKLVDACYNYWVGGMFPLWHSARAMSVQRVAQDISAKRAAKQTVPTCPFALVKDISTHAYVSDEAHPARPLLAAVIPSISLGWLFDQRALQQYCLLACQAPTPTSGLVDKPGKGPDYYHTCYALSGLSVAQISTAPLNRYDGGQDEGLQTETETEAEAEVEVQKGVAGVAGVADVDGDGDVDGDANEDVYEAYRFDLFTEYNPYVLGVETNRLLQNNAAFNLTEKVVLVVKTYVHKQQTEAKTL